MNHVHESSQQRSAAAAPVNSARTIAAPVAATCGDGADEDGVVFSTPLVAGTTATIEVTASTAGFLNAWIDFNNDNDWDDSGEQIFTDEKCIFWSL